MKKFKVLFVCLGNICRSPLGAAILRHKVKAEGLTDFIEVDSCGTSDYHIGDGADPRTIESAKRNGVAIDHCARQLSVNDLVDFDLILAMDKNNFNNILRIAQNGSKTHHVKLLREYDPKGRGEVPDPYHGGERDFDEVFKIVDRSTTKVLEEIRKILAA